MSTTTSTAPTTPLVARDLTRVLGDRTVLPGIDLLARPGEPLGIVGENGSGKSTLLRLLAGLDEPDSGTLTRPADTAYLGQEPDLPPDATVADVLATVLAPLHAAVTRLEELAGLLLDDPTAPEEYADLLAWAELHDAWDADRRAQVTAQRLGVGDLPGDRPVAQLSGGERTRLALAAIIVRRPACVLLDEPTNHLDDEAVAHLEEFLLTCAGVVVIASHDRALLDAVATAVVDLDPVGPGLDGRSGEGRGVRYTGGFSDYLGERRRARVRWEEAFAAWQEERDDLREQLGTTAQQVAHGRGPRDNDKFIHKFKGANVERTRARRIHAVERQMEVLDRERVPKPPEPLRLNAPHARGAATVSVSGLRVDGRVSVPSLDVAAGDHLLVTGPNGSGKSTLLDVLTGVLAPDSGVVQVRARVVGHLPQDPAWSRPDRTPADLFAAALAGHDGLAGRAGDDDVPTLADLGLLHPRDHRRPVGVLSVGQQRRLSLAIVLARRPDLLLLDEPTNHLSLALAAELEEAVGAARATTVLTSHDRWLRRRWEGPCLALPMGDTLGAEDATTM